MNAVVYNGDLCSVADINRVVDKFPDLYGVMIGRGLLANGSLAAGYKSGSEINKDVLYAKVRNMHSLMYQRYSETIEGGDAQLLLKMKSMWEYWLPGLDKKKRKAIHKANKLFSNTQTRCGSTGISSGRNNSFSAVSEPGCRLHVRLQVRILSTFV